MTLAEKPSRSSSSLLKLFIASASVFDAFTTSGPTPDDATADSGDSNGSSFEVSGVEKGVVWDESVTGSGDGMEVLAVRVAWAALRPGRAAG
jgi:hypothetical protein